MVPLAAEKVTARYSLGMNLLIERAHSLIIRHSLILRYGISGAAGIIIQTAALYIWVSILGLHKLYLLGVVTGFLLAVTIAFLLQKYWTFRNRDSRRLHMQFGLYALVALGNIIATALILEGARTLFSIFGIDFFHIWYVVVELAAVSLTAVGSFIANYFITFRQHEEAAL